MAEGRCYGVSVQGSSDGPFNVDTGADVTKVPTTYTSLHYVGHPHKRIPSTDGTEETKAKRRL